MPSITEISCKPYKDQRPGTAGLRKKVTVFQQPHYLETFVQSILNTVDLPANATLVVGGDGRYYNREAIQTVLSMAAANSIGHVIVGQGGLLSTPAAANLIQKKGAQLGLLLTASHNPGGPDGDFGVKFNMENGGQAPEHLTEAVYQASRNIDSYKLADIPAIDLDRSGTVNAGDMTIEVVDPVADYAELMESLFDFAAIRAMLAGGTRVHFDALNAATGPYAQTIICDMLGAPADSVANTVPLEDFGGLHPDPNPADAPHLVELAMSDAAPDLIAASDGDGDRNMILGRGLVVSPGDSLAIILQHVRCAPGYASGVPGVARSMPTSRAVDQVAADLGLPCYETPTGWRYFSNLLSAGRIGLCGEESFGTSSSHAAEKDGLWAVLFWLNMMAATGQPVADLVHSHWSRYGRTFFQRRDFFIPDTDSAQQLMSELTAAVPAMAGRSAAGFTVNEADVFNYLDPVDGSESDNQGIRIHLDNGGRICVRLSGTGTSGATLRMYLDRHTTDADEFGLSPDDALAPIAATGAELARITEITGLTAPTTII
ncbi:MAG: alpha-D-glucose phosphate-specific phosphoglucomutase [Gammaproteobacteria bacterium]|nr:alpha-D-glucose phosphate-specific phosphoglucomutase [Gammaproteobacteria bacterium]NND53549.1 alpha-D-glucose phosphate-specific phosphoglucomutase [Gammaproteobacteria bacterium]